MDEIDALKIFRLAKYYFYSFTGLLLTELASLLFFLSVYGLFTKILPPQDILITRGIFLYSCIILISAIVLIIWLSLRRVPTFNQKQIGILFGPVRDEELSKELSDLRKRLESEIRSRDFTNLISIKQIPPNHLTGPHDINIRLLNKARGQVLICGRFECLTVKGKQLTGFSSLTISCIKTILLKPQMIADALSEKKLGWNIENTIDKNIVANNLAELSRYIVALGLFSQNRFNESKVLLGLLYADVNVKYNQRRRIAPISRFIENIKQLYAISLLQEVRLEYLQELYEERLFQIPQPKLEAWLKQTNSALQLDPANSTTSYALIAIFQFLLGDIPAAKTSIRMSRNNLQKETQISCDFSEAFLLAYEGNLREAKKIYKRIMTYAPSLALLNSVLFFLTQAITKYPDKPQFKFIYALLNEGFGDVKLAITEYQEFIKVSESIPKFSQWVKEARFRIERLRNNSKKVPNRN
ncbi:MAG: hypothetical protein PHQ35_00770 [Phycisphaerae bacterium]|nr:hypothetical protein [Phycisphaerae bacterium]MDD5381402.1 hypothetical protein [Phycisphaerae bacterium]